MSKVSWEGARLNKGKHGTARRPRPGCCADLAHIYLHTLAAEGGSNHLGIAGCRQQKPSGKQSVQLNPKFLQIHK